VITYHQVRQNLADVKLQCTDVFESLAEYLYFAEELTFYIFRTDNNVVLARGVQGYEQAKKRASQLRQQASGYILSHQLHSIAIHMATVVNIYCLGNILV
jgi:hypothetical protein